jgi:PAS domain S-box-containing protein
VTFEENMQFSPDYIGLQSLESIIDYSPLIVAPETPVLEAIALMGKYGKGLLIKSESQLLGYLTLQDIVQLVASGCELKTATLLEVMQTPVTKLTVEQVNDLTKVASLLCESEFNLLVVVDEMGQVVGTITHESICQFLGQIEKRKEEISDRQNIEHQLRQSQQMLNLIMDTIPHHIFWKDINSRFLGCNRNFAQMVGMENPAAIIGKTDFDLIPNQEIAEFYRAYDAAIMQTNQPEYHLITSKQQADGSQIYLETNKIPLLDAQGKVIGMLGTIQDITERMRSQEALEQSEERFRFLAESIPQQVWIANANGNLEYVNQRGLNYFNCNPGQILGGEWQKWVHPEDLPKTITTWHQSLTTGQDYEIEFRLWSTASETYRWHLVRALPLRDRQGKIINWFGTNTDIHDRVIAEINLRESEEKYQRIATISPVGIFRCNVQGKCLYVNDRWCELTRLTAATAMGLGWIETLHPEDRERVSQEWREAISTNQPFRSEYRFWRDDGKITWVLGQAVPELMRENEIISYIGTFTDISDFKQIQSALAERVKLSDFRTCIDTILTQSETLSTLMKGCTDALIEHLDAAFARIWILDTEEQVLNLQVSSGIYTHINGCHSRVAMGRLKIGLIASEGQAHFTNSVQNDPRVNDQEWAKQQRMVAFAGYPLIVEGETIGVIAMFSRQHITESAFLALGIAAKEIAIGIKRKQTEIALRESEERFRNLVETSSDWIWEIDKNGVYTYVSPKVEEILGYQPQEVLGKTLFQLKTPEEAERVSQILAPIIANRKSFKCLENTNVDKNGNRVVLETNGVPIFDTQEKFCGYRGIDRDITIRKQEAAKLWETQQRLQAILDNLPAVMYLLDKENKYLLVNKQYEKLFNITQEQIVGKHLNELWPQEIAEQFLTHNLQVITAGIPTEIEELVPHQDALHTYLSIKFPLKDNNEEIYALCGISTDITERKLAEKSLLRLQKAIESTSDAISITDISGQAIYVNPAFVEVFDYTETQLNADGGFAANFRNKELFNRVFHTVQTGQSWRGELTMKTRNGEDVQVDLRTDAITDATGNIVAFVNIYTDITQRKLIEEGLRLRDRAMAASSNGVVIADVTSPDHPIIYVNSAFERMTGYSVAEVLGQPFPVVQKTDINEPALAELKTAMLTGKDCTVILRNDNQYGRLFWHELNISPVYDVYGSLTHYIGIQTDITERKQAETALLISQQRLQFLLTASPAVIYTSKARPDFGVIFISENIKTLIGYEAQEFLQNSSFWYSHIHPDDAPGVLAELSQVLETKQYSLEYRFLHKDGGYRWVYDQGKVVWDQAGNPLELVGYWADITSRKQLEQELRVSLEKEKELNELKSRFISMTSHEFRTPLSTILSSSELLEHYSYKWTQEKQLTHLHRIQTSVHRMTEMLDDILVSGKAEAGKLEYKPSLFDLVQYCRQLVEEVRLNLRSKHLISFISEYESMSCYMDEKLLGHILSNLLSNAIKYSADQSLVKFRLASEDAQVVFEIEDEGIGIPEEDLPHLFESFHRAGNVGNILGTGLGLAIVKKCVDIYQGQIFVHSKMGVGTKFTVKIPLKYS